MIMENERIYGSIFYPDYPEKKTTGVWLSISKESIFIEVPNTTMDSEHWQIILGNFDGIDEITFVDCYSSGYSLGSGGQYMKIYISYLIKGLHAYSAGDLSFNSIALTSPALTKWVIEKEGIRTLGNKTYQVSEEKEIARVTIESIEIVIRLEHSITHSFNNLEINKVCSISLESASMIDISVFSELMRHLKKLILFITHKDPEFERYFVYKDKHSNYEIINTNKSLKDSQFTQGIQVRYRDVNALLAEIMQKWFGLKKLHTVIDLILERCYNTEMSTQGYFLNVCMGIEIFQNTFGKKADEIINSADKINKEKVISRLDDVVLLKWFNEKSQGWNNPNLKSRLMQFEMEIKQMINGVFDLSTEQFIDKIKDTRNDIVHRGTYKKQFAGSELFIAIKVVEFVLRLEIMKLIGIDINKAPYSLSENARRNVAILNGMNKGKRSH